MDRQNLYLNIVKKCQIVCRKRDSNFSSSIFVTIVVLLVSINSINSKSPTNDDSSINQSTALDGTFYIDNPYKIVKTNDGSVRGQLKMTQFHGKPYHAYQGIPYAKAPIGDLRFKAPEPHGSWEPKIIDALEYPPACLQVFNKHWIHGASEDCLFLNIFVPAIDDGDVKKAVMFHIHGGAFIEGSGDDVLCGPDFLVERDVILVTMNYRLGLLGFLTLNTPDVSGNQGIKDQQLALKWISENIEYFGGDASRITILGHSAGSIAVNYHVINDESTKYFQRSISMSGTIRLNVPPIETQHLDLLYGLAEKHNRTVSDCDDLADFLSGIDGQELADAELLFPSSLNLHWSPTVEHENAIRPFLTKDPTDIYAEKMCINVSTLFAFNDRVRRSE